MSLIQLDTVNYTVDYSANEGYVCNSGCAKMWVLALEKLYCKFLSSSLGCYVPNRVFSSQYTQSILQ